MNAFDGEEHSLLLLTCDSTDESPARTPFTHPLVHRRVQLHESSSDIISIIQTSMLQEKQRRYFEAD